jgi:hypothetical protein
MMMMRTNLREKTEILIDYRKSFNATPSQLISPSKRGSRLLTEDEPLQGQVSPREEILLRMGNL